MKTIVTTLNAKYIHSSLAVRLLYVANKHRVDISFKEFTIKEDTDVVAGNLLRLQPDVVAIGVYIWNFRQIEQLISRLKQLKPSLIIILGGPEVSYDPAYFFDNWAVDYIISGEGEFVLGDLLQALESGETIKIDGVSSVGCISSTIVQADIEKLAALPSPYTLPEDKDEMCHKLVYFESSRGCPYQCQYCLSSLEKGVRYFPKEYILTNLQYLIDNGAKQIKFLDRTFNLNKKHTKTIFDFLVKNHHPDLSCQFEIYADLLSNETIDYLNATLPEKYFRFEIGIQSTHEPTNVAVKRKQNFPLLSANINRLMDGGKIDLHLDLIAGLPFETFDLFVQSFNHVFKFGAKELQLGFLKMLRGTNLRKNASLYGYVYNAEAPYEIVENNYISADELNRIHEAEHALEKYWNSGRFSLTMNAVLQQQYKGRYFQFFDELSSFSEEHNLPHHGYQLEDLFRNLHNFLLSCNINLVAQLRADYYNCFTQRPNGSWLPSIDKKMKKKIMSQLIQNTNFLHTHQLTPYIIEKQTSFDLLNEHDVLLTVFGVNNTSHKPIVIQYTLPDN